MPTSADRAVRLALELAEDLPGADLQELADALRAGQPAALELRQRAASSAMRAAVTRALSLPEDRGHLAGLLLGAAAATEQGRRRHLDVVWTGPPSAVESARLTPAVVAELLEAAQREVLLVGYAVQDDAHVRDPLRAAAARGVIVTLVLERPEDNPRFRQWHDPLADVAAVRLTWPQDRREQHASLHAKVLVVDRSAALIGSANLTGAAMTRNLECGLLVRGGPQPGQICDHIDSLQALGVLQRSR